MSFLNRKCLARLGTFLAISSCVLVTNVNADDAKSPAYTLTKTLKIGGQGGWDYATIDEGGKVLYLTRSTHTLAVDAQTGKIISDFGPTKRAHGVALVPDLNRGFISDGEAGTVVIFDLKTHEVLGTIAAADDADGIIYDPASRHIFVACGDAKVVVPIAADVDPKSGKADPSIDLDGKPEFLAADGAGKVYVNVQSENNVAVIDSHGMKLLSHWKTAPGASPTGLAVDARAGRLYVGCRNQKLIVMDTADGAVLADLPIGKGVDATAVDIGNGLASCSDGTLTVIRETSPRKFEVVQTVQTAVSARTMAVDGHTGAIYLPAADVDANTNGGRPRPLPGTFKIIVVSRSDKPAL